MILEKIWAERKTQIEQKNTKYDPKIDSYLNNAIGRLQFLMEELNNE